MEKSLDLRLIPEYDGTARQSIAEWLEKVELVCKLRGIDNIADVIPLRLTDGAFAVYLQLADEERRSPDKLKDALLGAFSADPYDAYEEFITRKLGAEEAPDVFLAALRRLASCFGGVPEKALACAFVSGLPENLRKLLKAGARMDDLSLNQIVGRVRAIIKDERPIGVQEVCLGARDSKARSQTEGSARRCFACDGLDHFVRDCPTRTQGQRHDYKGKRVRGGAAGAGILPSQTMIGALPTVQVEVDGVERNVLVDTGCSKCVAHVSCCASWRKSPASIIAVDGSEIRCQGLGTVQLQSAEGGRAKVDVVVTVRKPLGFDFILGMNAVMALGGVSISPRRHVRFGTEREEISAAGVAGIKLEEKDFALTFDPVARCWTTAWRWSDGRGPDVLRNKVKEYAPAAGAKTAYREELWNWIENGWLVPYDEKKYGPAKGLIPLIAVVQRCKEKVRPVMDFRELNAFIETFTADADVCAQRLREWRRQGPNVSVIDLKAAYLQIHVEKSLWPFQTVTFDGRRFCLTRLGFGLNVAPLVMKAVLNCVLAKDEDIKRGTSAYLDDILVNEDIVKASRVEEHLERYGLLCKPPERVGDGTRVLRLRVWGERDRLVWRRDTKVGDVPQRLSRRSVFSYCGRLTGHFPVCGWLRVAAAFLKRAVTAATSSWDEAVESSWLKTFLGEIAARMSKEDPVRGTWNVSGERARLWVDASALAIGAALEVDGSIVEDAAWLRPNDACHINMAEVDAAIKGLNLALSWNVKTVELMTDSSTVF
ncbi:hypothetical protein M514_25485 [Trichuris suis]|uniref:CCHC-type domain-containing protein n=1 Tax=Trichuris suis TaxID=68888 RepID=A0A085MYR6_9BILA|nr:hypothetical protein M514_25485 [Trichuris suis]